MEQKNKRLVWIDQLKAIGMFFVVWGHSIQRCETKVILKGIYSFHMPFFFILSGMTMNPDKYERTLDFVIAKAKAILYPYLVMSFVLLPLWYYNRSLGVVQDDSIFEIILGIFYSNSAEIRATTNAAWFMVTLFFAQLIFYQLHKYLKKDTELLLGAGILALLGVFSPMGKEVQDAPFHLDVALVAQFYVAAGFLMRKHLVYIMNLIGQFGKYKGAFLILGIACFFAYINTKIDFSNENYGNFLYTLISSFGITTFFIYMIQFMPNLVLLNYIGKNTMIYLMVHVPILRTLQGHFPIIEHSRLYATITAVVLYFGILLLCVIIQKYIPYLIKYPKKKEVTT